MKFKWEDTTSYSSGKRGKIEPESWGLRLPHLTIGVHRHIDYPGDWLLSCYDVRIERKQLESVNIEQAKAEAIKVVSSRLSSMANDLLMVSFQK